jgi:Domain of unknown function (DUF4350)
VTTAAPPAVLRGIDPTVRQRWRRNRVLALVAAIVLLSALAIAALNSAQHHGDLDPRSYDSSGTHALAALLADRGVDVSTTTDPAAAQRDAAAGTTLVVVHLERLTADQLAALPRVPANLVLIGADSYQLGSLAIGVEAAGGSAPPATVSPSCRLPVATAAGAVRLGGPAYRAPDGGQGCYPFGDGYGLVTYTRDGRRVSVLSSGVPLTNGELAQQGDAALGLGLLAGSPRVVWLVPVVLPVAQQGRHSVYALLPSRLKWALLQLLVAVGVIAVWRGRRFGRLVPERVPVVVRQIESVYGRARLYRRSRARDLAAAALRDGARDRLARRLGFGPLANREALVAAVARRSDRSEPDVAALLYGSTPADDTALVGLAHQLTTLEQEVTRP